MKPLTNDLEATTKPLWTAEGDGEQTGETIGIDFRGQFGRAPPTSDSAPKKSKREFLKILKLLQK